MKLKINIICFLIFLLVVAIHGQYIDSLHIELSKAVNDPSQYIELCKKIASSYHKERNYYQALEYYKKALEKSRKTPEKLKLNIEIGTVYIDSTDYTSALKYLEDALTITQKIKKIDEYPEIYDLIGMCYGLSNNLDEAIVAFKKSLEYNIEINDSSGIGFSLNNIAIANHFKGQYDKAVEYYIRACKVREAICDTTTLVASLISVGEIFRLKEEYSKSESYYTKVLNLKSSIKNKETLSYLYSELALINKIQGNYDLAFTYIDTALKYSKEVGYKRGLVTLKSYQASINKTLGNIDDAIVLYKETISGYEDIGFEPGIVQSNIALGEIYFDKEQYNEALKYIESIGNKAKNNNLLDDCTQIAELKYKINKALGNNSIALIDLENYMVLKDSLFNIGKEEKILEVETKYQTAEKEKQIALLDKENKIKEQKIVSRNYLLFLLATLILFTIILAISLVNRRKINSELEIERNRHQLLRSQMNPHFIYNALSAIQNFILQNEPLDSITYISEFSGVMRRVLEGSRYDLVLLKDEIELVNGYLTLQKLRFDNIFEFEVIVDDKLNLDLHKLPPMLSQPFIENAVEHGMRSKLNGEGKITVRYYLENSDIVVSIEDNGSGISTSQIGNKKHESMATMITKERIENIKKIQKMNIEFDILSKNKLGTTVKFKIPQKR